MAAREAPEEEGRCGADGDASSAYSDPSRTAQVTANITTTYNFFNVGQVVHVTGSNNTVVMSDNQVQVMQQNTQPENHAHSQSGSAAHHHTSPSSGSCSTLAAIQVACITYAAGPPDRMELLSLTQKLAGSLGSNWKILAAPLSIQDYQLASIEHDERTLLLKVNKLLSNWVDSDEGNDRRKLAMLLDSVAGFDLTQHCRVTLRTV